MSKFFVCGGLGAGVDFSEGTILGSAFEAFERTFTPAEASVLFVTDTVSSQSEYMKVAKSHHTRFFYAGEAQAPDFNLFDFAIGFDPISFGKRYLRLHPLVRFQDTFSSEVVESFSSLPLLPMEDRVFCDFICSNPQGFAFRDDFFRALNEVRGVSSYGRHLTNRIDDEMGQYGSSNWVYDKVRIQSRHLFSIAIENARYKGYTSEKILTALYAGSVPLYYGNDEIERDFNPERVINLHRFPEKKSAIDFIIALAGNPDEWNRVVSLPWFTPNQTEAIERNQDDLREMVNNAFSQVRTAPARGQGMTPRYYERNARRMWRISSIVYSLRGSPALRAGIYSLIRTVHSFLMVPLQGVRSIARRLKSSHSAQ